MSCRLVNTAPTPAWPPPDSARRRLEIAAISLTAERGADELTVEAICRRADEPHDSFFAEFADVDSCLLAAVDRGVEAVSARTDAAARDGEPRAVVTQVLLCLSAEPALARVALRDIGTLGRAGQARREQLIQNVSRGITTAAATEHEDPPAMLGTMVAGGLAEVAVRWASSPQPPDAEEIADQLLALWAPWLG